VYFNDNYGVINFGDSRNEFIYLDSVNENTAEVLLDVLRSPYVDTQDNK